MRLARVVAAALAALAALAAAAEAGERSKAEVECSPTDQKLVYDCMIMLSGRKSGTPMDGVQFTVGADMPSMPMAHNVQPAEAMPAGKPGMYHARIELEMHGEWALKMDVSSPARDTIIHKMHFGPDKAESGMSAMEHDSHNMSHEEHEMKHREHQTQ